MTSPYRENEHGLENAVEEAGQKLLDAAMLVKEQQARGQETAIVPAFGAPTKKREWLQVALYLIAGLQVAVVALCAGYSMGRGDKPDPPPCVQKDVEVFKTWRIGQEPNFKAKVSPEGKWHQYSVVYSPEHEGWVMFIDGKPAKVFISGPSRPGVGRYYEWTSGKDPAYWGAVKP